jgi:F-type H+-transporting ATPase subunit epsilon
MKLVIATPLAIVLEAEEVRAVKARDETGSFGILPGHADFLTVLPVSVLAWRDGSGAEHYAALRGGVFEVRDGQTVSVASPEAICGDDLARLENDVLEAFQRRQEEERAAHSSLERMGLTAVKHIFEHLRPQQGGLT